MPMTLPTAIPNSGNPATFNEDMDYFLGWMAQFAAWLNEVGFPTIPQKFGANGTAAVPVQSWVADPNTGMYRPGEGQIAWSLNGVKSLHLRPDGVELNGQTVGTGVQAGPLSNAFETGRLMKVGAFGWGGNSVYTGNLNSDDLPTGLYNADGNTIGKPTAAGCLVLHLRRAAVQIERQDAYHSDGSHYYRQRVGPGGGGAGSTPWASVPWERVDTVRISNANGEAVRFGDGTQICWGQLATSATDAVTRSFPAVFSSTPRVALTVRSLALLSLTPVTSGLNVNSFATSVFRSNDTRVTVTVDWIATGFWK